MLLSFLQSALGNTSLPPEPATPEPTAPTPLTIFEPNCIYYLGSPDAGYTLHLSWVPQNDLAAFQKTPACVRYLTPRDIKEYLAGKPKDFALISQYNPRSLDIIPDVYEGLIDDFSATISLRPFRFRTVEFDNLVRNGNTLYARLWVSTIPNPHYSTVSQAQLQTHLKTASGAEADFYRGVLFLLQHQQQKLDAGVRPPSAFPQIRAREESHGIPVFQPRVF